MKNKKLAYILLPVVLFIWGAVIWQLVDKPTAEIPVGSTATYEQEEITEKLDTVTLVLNYDDPFLKKRPKFKNRVGQNNTHGKNTAKKPVKKTPKKPVVVPLIQWPNINYSGKINSGVLVSINKRAHVIKEGQEVAGVSFDEIFEDSLHVSYKEEKKTINKNNL